MNSSKLFVNDIARMAATNAASMISLFGGKLDQNELNEQVARATGEPLLIVECRGFIPLTRRPMEREHDSEESEAAVNYLTSLKT